MTAPPGETGAYERSVTCRGHVLRVEYDGSTAEVWHDGLSVARRVGEGLLEFTAMEGEAFVAYDVLVLTRGYVRIKVGRNGRLVYSDYRSFPVDLTGSL